MGQLIVWLLALLVQADDANSNWPDFRGGVRGGVVEDKRLPETWSTTKNVLWKTEIPGKGWSSPIVWNNRYSHLRRNDGKEEAPKKGLFRRRTEQARKTPITGWSIASTGTRANPLAARGLPRHARPGRALRTHTHRDRHRRRTRLCTVRKRRPLLLRHER